MSNKLALTKNMLESQPTVKEMFELEPVKHNWVATYEGTTGKKDGAMRFEAEVVNYMMALGANKKLAECTRFSQYNAFMELCLSGLSLRDGLTYIIPYGASAQFQVGWRGRLEQILELPNVIHVQEPQLVYNNDTFDYEKGEELKIISHKPAMDHAGAELTHVYMHITFAHGKVCYMMERDEVLAIRDKYSKSYNEYVKKKAAGQWQDWMDEPMWVSSPGQAWKKTLVKRTWGMQKKLPKQILLEERLKRSEGIVPDVETDGNIKPVAPINEEEIKSVFLEDPDDEGYTAYEDLQAEKQTEEVKAPAEKPKAEKPAAAKPPKEKAPKPTPEPEVKVEKLDPEIDPNESF